jgi:hypothetical protein
VIWLAPRHVDKTSAPGSGVSSCKLTAWAEMLAFNDHPARRWEPERLGLLLFSIAARITSCLAHLLRFSDTHPWRTFSPQPWPDLRPCPHQPDQLPNRPDARRTDPRAQGTGAIRRLGHTYTPLHPRRGRYRPIRSPSSPHVCRAKHRGRPAPNDSAAEARVRPALGRRDRHCRFRRL